VQLETFRGWAGRSSDINYYLNSHHIDIHNWFAGHAARPVLVSALAAAGVAEGVVGRPCEDTITLSARWEARDGGGVGTAVYTASWIAPKVGAAGAPGRGLAHESSGMPAAPAPSVICGANRGLSARRWRRKW
jgi:hypothetical protein